MGDRPEFRAEEQPWFVTAPANEELRRCPGAPAPAGYSPRGCRGASPKPGGGAPGRGRCCPAIYTSGHPRQALFSCSFVNSQLFFDAVGARFLTFLIFLMESLSACPCLRVWSSGSFHLPPLCPPTPLCGHLDTRQYLQPCDPPSCQFFLPSPSQTGLLPASSMRMGGHCYAAPRELRPWVRGTRVCSAKRCSQANGASDQLGR